MNLYIRFFLNIFKNLIFPSKIDLFDESCVKLTVLPNDLDLNMHMNNGRFLTIMDIGRTDFTIKQNLHKHMWREKWSAVATAINVLFLKPLSPFAKYELRTKLISWDDLWFYMEQTFVKDEKIVAKAIVKATFIKKGKRIAPVEVMKTVKPDLEGTPKFPKYLTDLIEGEQELLKMVKESNRH